MDPKALGEWKEQAWFCVIGKSDGSQAGILVFPGQSGFCGEASNPHLEYAFIQVPNLWKFCLFWWRRQKNMDYLWILCNSPGCCLNMYCFAHSLLEKSDMKCRNMKMISCLEKLNEKEEQLWPQCGENEEQLRRSFRGRKKGKIVISPQFCSSKLQQLMVPSRRGGCQGRRNSP